VGRAITAQLPQSGAWVSIMGLAETFLFFFVFVGGSGIELRALDLSHTPSPFALSLVFDRASRSCLCQLQTTVLLSLPLE
jgi:hypothetical protein